MMKRNISHGVALQILARSCTLWSIPFRWWCVPFDKQTDCACAASGLSSFDSPLLGLSTLFFQPPGTRTHTLVPLSPGRSVGGFGGAGADRTGGEEERASGGAGKVHEGLESRSSARNGCYGGAETEQDPGRAEGRSGAKKTEDSGVEDLSHSRSICPYLSTNNHSNHG